MWDCPDATNCVYAFFMWAFEWFGITKPGEHYRVKPGGVNMKKEPETII